MKTFLSLFIFLLFSFTISIAQNEETPDNIKPVFGIKAGLNYSILSSSFNADASYRKAIHLGFFIKSKIDRNVYFRSELYYSPQGQKEEVTVGAEPSKTTLVLNYMNIPLLFEFGDRVSFQVGPQLSLLVAAKEKGVRGGKNVDDDLLENFRGIDYSLALGLAASPVKNLSLGLRFNIGLRDTFRADENARVNDFPNVKHRVIHLYLAYALN